MNELQAIERAYEGICREGRYGNDSNPESNSAALKVMMRLALRILLHIARQVTGPDTEEAA